MNLIPTQVVEEHDKSTQPLLKENESLGKRKGFLAFTHGYQ